MEKKCNDSNETQALLDFVLSLVGSFVKDDPSTWETDVEDTPLGIGVEAKDSPTDSVRMRDESFLQLLSRFSFGD